VRLVARDAYNNDVNAAKSTAFIDFIFEILSREIPSPCTNPRCE